MNNDVSVIWWLNVLLDVIKYAQMSIVSVQHFRKPEVWNVKSNIDYDLDPVRTSSLEICPILVVLGKEDQYDGCFLFLINRNKLARHFWWWVLFAFNDKRY